MVQFKKAEKKQAKLRAAFFGPAGSGKTMTALRVATGMGGPVALIDSEHGSASKYADRWAFDTVSLEHRTVAEYVETIKAAAAAGYKVLIIDGISHAWEELLADVERRAKARFRGNKWAAWSEGNPIQRAFVDAIISFPGHIIATMRVDTEWLQEKDDKGGVKPVKVGLKPQQGKGIEYEFDLLVELTIDHFANITKDRTGKFQDLTIEKPGEEFGQALVSWLDEGAAVVPEPAKQPEQKAESKPAPQAEKRNLGPNAGIISISAGQMREIKRQMERTDTTKEQARAYCAEHGLPPTPDTMTVAQASDLITYLKTLPDAPKQPKEAVADKPGPSVTTWTCGECGGECTGEPQMREVDGAMKGLCAECAAEFDAAVKGN